MAEKDDELAEADVATIRRSIREVEDGKGQEAGAFHDALRARLLQMKAEESSTPQRKQS